MIGMWTISPSMQSTGVLPNPPEHVVIPITSMATSAACTALTAAVKLDRSVLLISTPCSKLIEMDVERAELALLTASWMAASGVMRTQPWSIGGFCPSPSVQPS